MCSTIAVEELRIGILVQLKGGWGSHPIFPLSSFPIANERQLAILRGPNLKQVCGREKSDLPESAAPVTRATRGPAAL